MNFYKGSTDEELFRLLLLSGEEGDGEIHREMDSRGFNPKEFLNDVDGVIWDHLTDDDEDEEDEDD